MKRRFLTQGALGLIAFPSLGLLLNGCNLTAKNNIKGFGKPFRYLTDPSLREKETGDALMTVKSALFGGVDFQGQTWRNVSFIDCDFAGGYEIKLDAMENCSFENCKIVGIHDFGVMTHVRFFKCLSGGASNWGGQTLSKNVVFEECNFIGDSSDGNHQGGIGTYGEAEFVNCKIKLFAVTGYTKLVMRGCECEDVRASLNNEEVGAAVLIENCKLQGVFDMVPATLQSFTIRDTIIDTLDLNNATVKGDILMEQIKGGAIKIGVREGANSFVLKNSQVYGNGEMICSVYAGAFKTVLIEDCVFGGGPNLRTGIGGGFEPDDKTPQAVLTKSFTLRRNKVPSLRTGRLNAAHVMFEGNTIDSLEIIQSRIGKLEMQGNTFSRSVDFSGTQVGESKVQTLAKGQAKLDGSNIKLN